MLKAGIILSDKMPCTVGFVNCFLRVPLACLGSRANGSKGWYRKGTLKKQFRKPTVQGILSVSNGQVGESIFDMSDKWRAEEGRYWGLMITIFWDRS